MPLLLDPVATPEIAPADQPAPPSARKPSLPALTGIRTILALGIILFHFTPPHLQLLSPIIDNAFVFVGFFFLISGFILAYNYADRAHTLDKRKFWIARFSRLYPVYLLALAFSFKMLQAEYMARSHHEFWQGLLLTPLLLQGWSPSLATFWNTVAWTLSAEVILYLAFPWLIRLRWPTRPFHLFALFLGLWALGLLPHTLYMVLNPDHLSAAADRYTSTFWIRVLKYTPLPYLCTFLAGLTLGKLHLALSISQRQRLALAALSLLATAVFFYTVPSQVPYILMHGGLATPLFAVLILGLSGNHPIATFFSWRPLILLGETTFCLYLLHFNAFILIHDYHLPERLHVAAFDPWISYVAIIALGFAAFHFVEHPARRAILSRLTPST